MIENKINLDGLNKEEIAEVLNFIGNVKHKDAINKATDALIIETFPSAKETVVNFFKNYSCTAEEKLEFLNNLVNDSKLIKAEDLINKSGSIKNNISEDVSKTEMFTDTFSALYNENNKAVGKGEVALELFSSNTSKPDGKAGDLKIDGKAFEVKNAGILANNYSMWSSIDSGLSLGKIQIDEHNESFLLNLGVSAEALEAMNTKKNGRRTKGFKMIFTHELVSDKLTVENLVEYFTPLYGNSSGVDTALTLEELKSLAADVVEAVANGDESTVHRAIAQYVFKLYKTNKGFDALLMIKESGEFVCFTDEIPADVKVRGVFCKGGDTQSLPAGYINLTF